LRTSWKKRIAFIGTVAEFSVFAKTVKPVFVSPVNVPAEGVGLLPGGLKY
jgi:hypothetical protein